MIIIIIGNSFTNLIHVHVNMQGQKNMISFKISKTDKDDDS